MADIDDIQDINPFRQYEATAGQTLFEFPFPFFTNDDLVVYVGSELQTLTTDYTVSGAGDDTGGSITFTSALSGGETVTILRDTAVERRTDFQFLGAIPSTSLNRDLDRLIIIAQELKERIGRGFIADPATGLVTKDMTFDGQATVKGLPAPTDPGDAVNLSTVQGFLPFDATFTDSVGAIRSAPETTTRIFATGYYEPGDQGGGFFYADTDDTTSSDNGGSVIVATSGVRWKREEQGRFTPKQFGAKCDGVEDDTTAMQRWLNAGGGYLPRDGEARITDTLVIPNRTVMLGANASWSPDGYGKMFGITWDGDAGGVMIQCAQNAVGTPSTSSRAGLEIGGFVLEGSDVAGIGFYGNYISDESVVRRIVVRGCNLFGFLMAKLYYCRFEDLTARNCDGVGIALGWNWDSSYDDISINGVEFTNLRAAQCGQEYNATTAPTGFDITSEPRGGCGIYLGLESSSQVRNCLGETCYGPGVTIDGQANSRCLYDGIYVEGNGATVVADGTAPVRFGMLLINDTSQIRTQFIRSFYGHEPDDNNRIRYQAGASAAGDFIFEHTYNAVISSSVAGRIPVRVINGRGTLTVENSARLAKNLTRAYRFSLDPLGGASGVNRLSEMSGDVGEGSENWASAAALDLVELSLRADAQNRAVGASVMVYGTFFASNGAGNETHVITKTWLINISCLRRFSGSVTTASDINELASTDSNSGGSLLSLATPTVDFDVTDVDEVVATIQVVPTSTGAQANNAAIITAFMMSGGARSGAAPQVTDIL